MPLAEWARKQLSDEELRQKRFFDLERNQYARSALLEPPLHTALELERIVDALQGIHLDGPVIDFGAGTGRLSVALARAGHSVLAVDVSRSSLDVLDEVAQELGLRSIETAVAFPEGEFPAVVGADVLHHVDMNEYLPRIRGLLPTGGKVVFSEPGGLNPAWYLYLPLRGAIRVETGIVKCTISNLGRTFVHHGFRDVTITGLGLLPRPLFRSPRSCRLHDTIGNRPILRRVAYRYIIEATK